MLLPVLSAQSIPIAKLSLTSTPALAEAELSFSLLIQPPTQPPTHPTGKVSKMQYRTEGTK